MEVGNPDNPLMKKLYIRAAIAEGMNRQSLIGALYGKIAPGLKPLNNPEYEQFAEANGKNAFFNEVQLQPEGRDRAPEEERLHRRSFDAERQQPQRVDLRRSEDRVQVRHDHARVA